MAFFFCCNGKYNKNQVEAISSYQYEPEPGAETSSISDESDSEQGSVLFSSEEEVDTEFERANAWRLEALSWCKCGHCAVSTKIIECFCCLEKAVEYDEYGMLLDQVEAHGNKCLTKHRTFETTCCQRCSRWIFQILGKKAKTISCLCVFKHTRTLCVA